jgi:hypothetical protein
LTRIFLILGLILLLVILYPVGCGSSGGGGRDTGHPTPAAFTSVEIASVRDLGPIEFNPAIRMRDVGYSAMFEGQSSWIFGDTFLMFANADNQSMLSNSWSYTYDIDAGDGLAGFQEQVDEVGAPVPFFPLTEQEMDFNLAHAGDSCTEEPCNTRWSIWPGTIVLDEVKSLAYAFYHKVLVQKGDFNFRHVGHSIAVWKEFADGAQRPVFGYSEEYPTLFFTEDRDGFGSAAVLVDRQLYVYGCELLLEELVKPCRLARVPLADILDRNAWSFYAGDGRWSPELGDAVTVFHGNNMLSVFYNAYIGLYIAVYSQPMDTRVMLRTAPSPVGPWSEPVEVFTAETPVSASGWIYDALAHPEYSEGDGRIIYITYSRQTGPMRSEMRQVAVELEKGFQ